MANHSRAAILGAVVFCVFVLTLLSLTSYAQTITLTFQLTCDKGAPGCPNSNLVVARQVGQVASDNVEIATVISDVPGFTSPVPVTDGLLNWTSTPATNVFCDFTKIRSDYFDCYATYASPGGSTSVTGSVFGLPEGSTLLTASFFGGATSSSELDPDIDQGFSAGISITYVNPVLLANLGMAGLPNSGTGTLSDTFSSFYPDYAYNFNVSVTFTTIGNLQVIHNFTGGSDGAGPGALIMDRAGNIYGTTTNGAEGYGTVFKLTYKTSGWVLNPLYSFGSGNDGAVPSGKVIIGPDGSIYGATQEGGGCGFYRFGCGTIYNLRPKPTACTTALCPWVESVIYRFNGTEGLFPTGGMVFDASSDLYGTTSQGGDLNCSPTYGCGTVYELMPSEQGWTHTVLYTFTGGADGGFPNCCLIFDQAGNLYGTTSQGGANGCGTFFELTPSGSGWTETVLYNFDSTSGSPGGNMVVDQSGNFYGAAGTIFKLTRSGGGWSYSSIYPTLSNGLTMDAAGNLYGADGGPYGNGNLFQLTPSNGTWIYNLLYDFISTGNGGTEPSGNVVLDPQGNLYGSAAAGGLNGDGVLFELPHH
jgi:uncharacterized repeat protein (TIGR03803 family)